MSGCRIDPSQLSFSPAKAARRTTKAVGRFGESVVRRILAFALFLMGAERREIASSLSMPVGTLFSLLTRVRREGLPALEDRRRESSRFLPPGRVEPPEATLRKEEGRIVVDLGMQRSLELPRPSLQAKVVLLTLAECGLLRPGAVAEVLDYTPAYLKRLCRQLFEEDVEALLDHRRGQQDDYRMNPRVKAELVQQAAAHTLSGRSASASALTRALNERLGWTLAERTVRLHLSKLGLSKLTQSLPRLVDTLKKTPEPFDGR